MNAENHLGIYISKNAATVVCLGSQGAKPTLTSCFTVSVEQTEQQTLSALAGIIAQQCRDHDMKFAEVVVALDSALFMQHSVHSEFKDTKQMLALLQAPLSFLTLLFIDR